MVETKTSMKLENIVVFKTKISQDDETEFLSRVLLISVLSCCAAMLLITMKYE